MHGLCSWLWGHFTHETFITVSSLSWLWVLLITALRTPGLVHKALLVYSSYALLPQELLLLTAPKVRSDFGNSAFAYAAPHTRNCLWEDSRPRCSRTKGLKMLFCFIWFYHTSVYVLYLPVCIVLRLLPFLARKPEDKGLIRNDVCSVKGSKTRVW